MRKKLIPALLLGMSVVVGTALPVAAEAAHKARKTQKTAPAKKSAAKPKVSAQTNHVDPASHASLHKVSSHVGRADMGEAQRLAVQSSAALVLDQSNGDVIYQKNAASVVPIASISKLMTAMVVLDSQPSMSAPVTVGEEDVDTLKGTRSRLSVGTVLTREHALLLALMSSENRAAHTLARHYPGGIPAFVEAMNRKARSLGMMDTHFEDPTGLTSNNVSTATDLAKMVAAAHTYPLIREFSTTAGATVETRGRVLEYHNTNALVKSSTWDIGLSKTGFINEAGKCLVMQARVAERPVVIVLLDSAGKMTRIGDANRIKRWMESASLGRRTSRA